MVKDEWSFSVLRSYISCCANAEWLIAGFHANKFGAIPVSCVGQLLRSLGSRPIVYNHDLVAFREGGSYSVNTFNFAIKAVFG